LCHFGFLSLKPFSKIKINQINHLAFYPKLHDFDPARVRRQKTLSFQINKIQKTFSFYFYFLGCSPKYIQNKETRNKTTKGMIGDIKPKPSIELSKT